MAVVEITKDNFDKEVKESDTPVIVDFWAEWCGPCQAMKPIFHELSGKYAGKVKFCSVDTEAEPDISAQFDIRGIPCLIVFKDGKEVDRIVGIQPEDELKAQIDKIAG